MKVTFVAIGSEQLAISLLSAVAKRDGHEVSLAFSAGMFHDRYNLEIPWLARYFDDSKQVIDKIENIQPDVIAFSVLTSTYRWSLEIATEAKKRVPGLKVIFGGVHVSAVPEVVMKNLVVDYAVVGEGEIAFPEILNAIEKGGGDKPIPNTRFRTADGTMVKGPQVSFNQEMDALPGYDKTIWEEYLRIEDKYLTMASRGCPYRCTFCFNNFYAELPEEKKKGKYVRIRSARHMMDELRAAKKRYPGMRFIDFQDDIFTTSKEWLKEFLPMYKKEIGLPFQCLTHPKYMDGEIAMMLKDAGCTWVQMGVQSMDEDFKKKNLKRYERSDNIEFAARAMNRAGLKSKFDHMMGLPGEPIEAQEKALTLYSTDTPNRIQVFWTSFLPGTEIMREGLEAGIITPEIVDRLNEGVDFYFYRNTDNIKNPELVKLYFAYEVLFRTMPILPKFIRTRIKPKHVMWMPKIIAAAIMNAADLITGFWWGNGDFYAYLRYYMFQIKKWAYVKLGLNAPRATQVKAKTNSKPASLHTDPPLETDLTRRVA